MNLDQFRNFVNASETITVPNPMVFTGAVIFSGTVTLSGATITGLTVTDSAVSPDATDGASLGTTALMWSDLFLASGAVINFNNGDVTVTHAANSLAFAGASSGYSFDALVFPATSDGAALGSTSKMWSDLFLASGAVINFNNGDVTLTHAANKLTLAGGELNTGADAAGVDVKLFGGTASNYLLYDASEDQLAVVQANAATSGVERAVNVSQTHTGVGASAEALTVALTSNVAFGSYANAICGRIDLSTTGLVSGLIGVVCGELNMPGGTVAGAAGTYSVFEAEINCPTSYDSNVPIHVFQINAWGAAVGKFDDYGYLFDLTGVTSDAAHIWYDNQKAAPAVEEFVRVKTPSGVRYLALYDANA